MRVSISLFSIAWLAAPCIAAAPSDQPQRVALLPPDAAVESPQCLDDTELVGRGARIGAIEIHVDDVFEETPDLGAPYRVANSLHISTRHNIIANQLLFDSGDLYDPRLTSESARLLRAQRYLNAASIVPVRYHEHDNTVDLSVHVHDVWTLSPGFSFGRKGGANQTNVEFEDTNFLGRGKHLFAAHDSDVDRSRWTLGYADPQLSGSRWQLKTAYSTASDGGERAFAVGRPFFALDTRWSANAAALDSNLSVPRYSEGRKIGAYDMHERSFAFGGGISNGLQNGWVKRLLAGFSYEAREFSPGGQNPAGALPDDRTFSYPWIGIDWLEDRYVTTRNLDLIGLTEDVHVGRRLDGRIGYASTALGSTRDALVLQGDGEMTLDLGGGQFLVGELSLETRYEDGDFANALLHVGSRLYLRSSERRLFFASVSGSMARKLDAEKQLLLGGDTGLRGYPLRYQAGTASALFTLEERFYTDWQPLKLANVGAAIFFDAGRTWGRDPYAAPAQGWLKDVGVGLRLGSVRSGLGNVLHIDIAFPLDATANIDGMQLLIETRKSF